MTPDEILLQFYKDQFEWAVAHRNSIYQRLAILLAFVGIVLGLLGVVLTASDRPTFELHWAWVLRFGVGILVLSGIIVMLVMRAKRTGAGTFFGVDPMAARQPQSDKYQFNPRTSPTTPDVGCVQLT